MSDTPAISRLQDRWDAHVSQFLAGGPAVPDGLHDWANGYSGRGRGAVQLDALPEPYLGDLDAEVRGVFLALNPGNAVLSFQGRQGKFASDITRLGSYRAWAKSWPYLCAPWISEIGPSRHHQSRFKFLRTWFGDESMPSSAMVGFEMYPWHSPKITGRMRPPADVIREWVWEPIAELGAPVFAFGAPWFEILEDGLGLSIVERLGVGGRDYGSAVESRSVLILRDEQTGVTVLAEKHTGGAGPPSAIEVALLRNTIALAA